MPRHAVTAGHVVEPRVLKDLILSSEAKYELAWLDDLAGALAYEVVLGKPLSTADLPRVLLLRAHRPIPPALTAAAAATAGLTLPQLRARAATCADDFKTCLLSL
jgi:hypothetical protein